MNQKNETAVSPLQSKNRGLINPVKHADKLIPSLFKQIFYLIIILASLSFTSCEKYPDLAKNPEKVFQSFNNKVILDWNIAAFDALDAPNYLNTLSASRLTAMVHIAQHDALNSIAPVYNRYINNTTDNGAHPVAAAAVAAHTVLLSHLPEKKSMLDERLAQSLDTIVNATAKQKGIELGLQSGNAIVELRKNDGAFQNPIAQVPPSTVPGVYQPVPPFDFVFAPFWKTMQPFGLLKPEQFRSAPLPGLNTKEYEKDFDEVKAYGDKNSTVRSAEQTFYAAFWYEFSEIGWNRIARIAAGNQKTDLLSTARLFALLNIALADSYTAGWDSKFHYNFWRPFTAINAPSPKVLWEPLLPTPPVQDYPSTHSVLGNAGATVLTAFYGKKFEFTMTSTSSNPANATRNFDSFLKAADENADSRVMAGIHFRFATEAGQKMGNQIGSYVVNNLLKKNK